MENAQAPDLFQGPVDGVPPAPFGAGRPYLLGGLVGPGVQPGAALLRALAIADLDGREPENPGRRGRVVHGVVLEAGQQGIAGQSAALGHLVLVRQARLECGNDPGLTGPGRPLDQGDVRGVEGDVQGLALAIRGVR